MKTLAKIGIAIAWSIAGVLTWWLAFHLIVPGNVGAIRDFWAPERLLAYATFVAAPALTFLPLARFARVPFLEVEALIGWSTSLFVWTFIDPNHVSGPLAMLVVLLPLLISIASLCTSFLAILERRLGSRLGTPPDPLRARRRGYVLGLFVIGCLLLHSLQGLTAINIGLLALIALFVELLAMTWFAPVREGGTQPSGTTRDRRGWDEYGRGAPRPR